MELIKIAKPEWNMVKGAAGLVKKIHRPGEKIGGKSSRGIQI
jgi:hypothetical protein